MIRLLLKSVVVVALASVGLYGVVNLHRLAAQTNQHRQVEKFFDDGTLMCEFGEDGESKFHGTMTQYHPNGTVSVISEWDHGIEIGTRHHFSDDGAQID